MNPLVFSNSDPPSDKNKAHQPVVTTASELRELESLPVASCVSRDYTLTVRSLRATAGRRAAQCEEQRKVEAGKKVLKVNSSFFLGGGKGINSLMNNVDFSAQLIISELGLKSSSLNVARKNIRSLFPQKMFFFKISDLFFFLGHTV